VKNWNFGEKLKFGSKIRIYNKKGNSTENKICVKHEIKKRYQVQILVKNRNFYNFLKTPGKGFFVSNESQEKNMKFLGTQIDDLISWTRDFEKPFF